MSTPTDTEIQAALNKCDVIALVTADHLDAGLARLRKLGPLHPAEERLAGIAGRLRGLAGGAR